MMTWSRWIVTRSLTADVLLHGPRDSVHEHAEIRAGDGGLLQDEHPPVATPALEHRRVVRGQLVAATRHFVYRLLLELFAREIERLAGAGEFGRATVGRC